MTKRTVPAMLLLAFSGATSAAAFQLWEQNASGIATAYAGSAAVADNASTIFFNPAGITLLPGIQVSAGVAGVAPSYKFSNGGSSGLLGAGGDGGNAGGWSAVPNAYISWQLAPDWFVGLGVSAPFGLNTEYDQGNWIGLESNFSTAGGAIHAMADVWLQINKGFDLSLDLTSGDPGRVPLEGLAKIDLSGNGGRGDLLNIDANAVEKLGQRDLVVNDQTGSGYVQLMIQGDANDAVNLADAEHWTRNGTTVVDGETYEVLTAGDAQLLVGVKLQHDPNA